MVIGVSNVVKENLTHFNNATHTEGRYIKYILRVLIENFELEFKTIDELDVLNVCMLVPHNMSLNEYSTYKLFSPLVSIDTLKPNYPVDYVITPAKSEIQKSINQGRVNNKDNTLHWLPPIASKHSTTEKKDIVLYNPSFANQLLPSILAQADELYECCGLELVVCRISDFWDELPGFVQKIALSQKHLTLKSDLPYQDFVDELASSRVYLGLNPGFCLSNYESLVLSTPLIGFRLPLQQSWLESDNDAIFYDEYLIQREHGLVDALKSVLEKDFTDIFSKYQNISNDAEQRLCSFFTEKVF